MSAQPIAHEDMIPGLVIAVTPPPQRNRHAGSNIALDLAAARQASARAELAAAVADGRPRGPKPAPKPAETGQGMLLDLPSVPEVAPFVENVEWLLDAGETLDGIAYRLGMDPESVLRQLAPDRHNRVDLRSRLSTDCGQTAATPAVRPVDAGVEGVTAGQARSAALAVASAAARVAGPDDAADGLARALAALGLVQVLRQGPVP